MKNLPKKVYLEKLIEPPNSILNDALISADQYYDKYQDSIKNPESFWEEIANTEIEWFKKWDKIYSNKSTSYAWFENAQLNITHNCLDRHVREGRGSRIAFYYVNEDNNEITITYAELLKKVNKFANGLKSLGAKKGDIITIYMPLTIELIISMLACARIGVNHSVVFAGFSAKALKNRIEDAKSKIVITSTGTKRRGKIVNLKAVVEDATKNLDFIDKIIVFKRGFEGEEELAHHEIEFNELINKSSSDLTPEVMDSEDSLFILYTSGSTGTPKGIVHTTGGYNLYTHLTTKLTFDIHKDDVFWCTADPGWITGHSYVVYGPLSNGITSVIFEGAPDYPTPEIWWSIIEKYKVTKFYTAPTAIRMFMKYGEEFPKKHDLSSLKIIGTVGEPINPEAWNWYNENIGNSKAAVVDTWWQTETGGHILVTMPSMPQKPGRTGLPFLGLEVDVVDKNGNPVPLNSEGFLIIKKPWPAALRTCWNNEERFEQYWTEIKNYYTTGDIATKDEDGYITVLGRSDDVIKVSGHRLGSAEIESALVDHKAVAEAAVIGVPDDVKGEVINAFVILKKGVEQNEELKKELIDHVKSEIGSFAKPSKIEFVEKLPKTRSGKIMRRVLRAEATGKDPGDTSTLEE